MRKICIISGTRAEYGLLYWLMQEVQEDADLELQIIATGMHLSPEFGLTYRQIDSNVPSHYGELIMGRPLPAVFLAGLNLVIWIRPVCVRSRTGKDDWWLP